MSESTKLADRLRAISDCDAPYTSETLDEAADELERMTELNEASREALAEELEARKEDAHTIAALRAELDYVKECNQANRDAADALRAENEAQKEALADQLTARKYNEAEIERLRAALEEARWKLDNYRVARDGLGEKK